MFDQMMVDEFSAVVAVQPAQREGRLASTSRICNNVAASLRLGRARISFQVV